MRIYEFLCVVCVCVLRGDGRRGVSRLTVQLSWMIFPKILWHNLGTVTIMFHTYLTDNKQNNDSKNKYINNCILAVSSSYFTLSLFHQPPKCYLVFPKLHNCVNSNCLNHCIICMYRIHSFDADFRTYWFE